MKSGEIGDCELSEYQLALISLNASREIPLNCTVNAADNETGYSSQQNFTPLSRLSLLSSSCPILAEAVCNADQRI